MAIREAAVRAANPKMHAVEPVYTGSDIALGITVQMQIGERRQIAMQTHVTRDCSETELNTVLDKATAALDRQNSKYRIQELKILLSQTLKQYSQSSDNLSDTQLKWQHDWFSRQRRGPLELTESQRQVEAQSKGHLERLRNEIRGLESEIGTLENQVKG